MSKLIISTNRVQGGFLKVLSEEEREQGFLTIK